MDMALTGLDRILANLHAVASLVAVPFWLLRKVYRNALLPGTGEILDAGTISCLS